jgi:hypothetical protein
MYESSSDAVRELAADLRQNPLVRDTRYVCGVADALMNPKLPRSARDAYLEAHDRYDRDANAKFFQAVNEFDTQIAAGESPDVLPIYIAAFLYYAAGVSKTLFRVRRHANVVGMYSW